MKTAYDMLFPRNVVFGCGEASRLPELVPDASRVMLVCGRSAESNGLLESLERMFEGFDLTTVCGVMAEPDLDEVDRLAAIGREFKVNVVVAVGGGSVIDCAKAAACIIGTEYCIRDFFYGRRELDRNRHGVFLAALPTTSGTGAEITPNAVFIDPETMIKKSIRHESVIPDLAIVDPLLTLSTPSGVSAASGLDALTQAVEAHISRGANPFTDALSARAVSLIMGSLETVCAHPDNVKARTDMAEGSMLTALAFSQSGLGAVHGIGHPLGSALHLSHGLSCAVLLVPVLEWNKVTVSDKLAGLACCCGGVSADDFIAKVRDLRNRIGVPGDFKAAGLSEEHFPFIIKNCRSGSMKSNPREMSDSDVEAMLRGLC